MIDPAKHATDVFGPSEMELLQRVFDRVCMWCHIERPSERADDLACFLMNAFRAGTREEATLFEGAMEREGQRSDPQPKHEHDVIGHRKIN